MVFQRKFLLLLLLAFCDVCFAQSVQSEIDPEKRLLIAQFMDLSGSNRNLYILLNQIPAQAPESTDPKRKEYLRRFSHKFDKANFAETVISTYDRHFSKDELKALILFYKTPLARKGVTEVPDKVQESLMNLMEKIGEEVSEEIDAENIRP